MLTQVAEGRLSLSAWCASGPGDRPRSGASRPQRSPRRRAPTPTSTWSSPAPTWTIEQARLHSRHPVSPYNGWADHRRGAGHLPARRPRRQGRPSPGRPDRPLRHLGPCTGPPVPAGHRERGLIVAARTSSADGAQRCVGAEVAPLGLSLARPKRRLTRRGGQSAAYRSLASAPPPPRPSAEPYWPKRWPLAVTRSPAQPRYAFAGRAHGRYLLAAGRGPQPLEARGRCSLRPPRSQRERRPALSTRSSCAPEGTVGFNTNTWAAQSALEVLLCGTEPERVLVARRRSIGPLGHAGGRATLAAVRSGGGGPFGAIGEVAGGGVPEGGGRHFPG